MKKNAIKNYQQIMKTQNIKLSELFCEASYLRLFLLYLRKLKIENAS